MKTITQNKGLLVLFFNQFLKKTNQMKLHTCLQLKPSPHAKNLDMISVTSNTITTSCQYSTSSFENTFMISKKSIFWFFLITTHQSCSTTLSGISLVRSYVFQIQMNYPVSRKSKYRLYAEAYLDQYILIMALTHITSYFMGFFPPFQKLRS